MYVTINDKDLLFVMATGGASEDLDRKLLAFEGIIIMVFGQTMEQARAIADFIDILPEARRAPSFPFRAYRLREIRFLPRSAAPGCIPYRFGTCAI